MDLDCIEISDWTNYQEHEKIYQLIYISRHAGRQLHDNERYISAIFDGFPYINRWPKIQAKISTIVNIFFNYRTQNGNSQQSHTFLDRQ